MADITAAIEGIDKGLKDALDKVENASRQVASAVEDLDDQLEGLPSSVESAEQSLSSADEELGDVKRGAERADESIKGLSQEFVEAVGDVETLNLAIGGATNEINQMGASSEAVQSIVDELGSEMNEAAASATGLSGALQTTSAAQGQVAATSRTASNGLDALQGEANEATGALVGTASAAELLSLQSSALSINVGAFTVALRNLTTQVPILVATLGNLGGAFTGLAGAISAVGLGGVAIALGGMAAKAEQIAGPIEGTGNHLEALGTIADEIKPKFIEAIQPLINAEGVISFFDDTIDGLAETVGVVSQSLADAFNPGNLSVGDNVDQVQSLEETLRGIGSAVLGGLEPVTNAITDMVFTLGDDIERLAEGFMSVLPTIIRSVTTTTEGMLQVFDMATQNLGGFIKQITTLGESIGAGLAPVLDAFFEIGKEVGEMLNGLGEDIDGFNGNVVATTVKIVALLAAVNRLAGVMGSLIMPLTKVTGTLGLLITRASGPMAAFFATLSTGFGVVTDLSSGLGNLAKSFEMMLPPLGQSTSALTAISNKFQNSDRNIVSATGSLLDFGDSADESSTSLGRFGDKISNVKTRVGQLFTQLTSATAFGELGDNLSEGLDVELSNRDMISGDGLLDNLGLNRTRTQQIQYKLRTSDNQFVKTGFAGIQQKLANFRDGSLIPGLQSIRESFFDGMRDISSGIRSTSISDAFSEQINKIKQINPADINSVLDPVQPVNLDKFSFSTIRSSVSDGLDSVGQAYHRGGMRVVTNVENALDRVGQAYHKKATGLVSRISGISMPDFDLSGMFSGVPTSIDQANEATKGLINSLERVSASGFRSYITNLPGINTVVSTSMDDLQSSVLDVGQRAGISKSEMQDFGQEVRETAGKATISSDSVDDLSSKMREAGASANMSGKELDQLESHIEDLRNDEKLASMTTEQLKDNLDEANFSARKTSLAVDSLDGEVVDYSISAQLASVKTSLLSGATSVLSSIMTGLAISVGVLAAGFLALVAVVGTAGAVLQKLGQEGKSVGDIMNILKGFLVNLAEAAMPFVTASTAAMMDVFNSLAAVGSELMSAFQDIAVELGLIQDPIAGGKDGMERFMAVVKSVSESLTPLINAIGDITREIAGHLIVAIRNASDTFVRFLDKINANQIIKATVSSVKTAADVFMDVYNAMKPVINIMSTFVGAIVKGIAILGGLTIAAYLASSGFGTLSVAVGSLTTALAILTSPISILIGVILGLIGVVVLIMEYFGLFGAIVDGLEATLSVLVSTLSVVISVIVTVLTALYDLSLIGETISVVGSALGILGSALGKIMNVLGAIASVVGIVLGVFVDLADGLVSYVINKGINLLTEALNNAKNAVMGFLNSGSSGQFFTAISDGINTVINGINEFITIIKNVPSIIQGFFAGTLEFVEHKINKFIEMIIGLVQKFNSIASNIDGVDTIETPERVDLIEDGSLQRSSERAKTAAQNAKPDDANANRDQVTDPITGTEDSEQADTAGTNDGVTVVEGNTRNIFNQTISANPEDEVQMGRIAEDAMAEANSFKRRQEGSQ